MQKRAEQDLCTIDRQRTQIVWCSTTFYVLGITKTLTEPSAVDIFCKCRVHKSLLNIKQCAFFVRQWYISLVQHVFAFMVTCRTEELTLPLRPLFLARKRVAIRNQPFGRLVEFFSKWMCNKRACRMWKYGTTSWKLLESTRLGDSMWMHWRPKCYHQGVSLCRWSEYCR